MQVEVGREVEAEVVQGAEVEAEAGGEIRGHAPGAGWPFSHVNFHLVPIKQPTPREIDHLRVEVD